MRQQPPATHHTTTVITTAITTTKTFSTSITLAVSISFNESITNLCNHHFYFMFFYLLCCFFLKVIGGELQERLIPVPYSKSSTDQAVSRFLFSMLASYFSCSFFPPFYQSVRSAPLFTLTFALSVRSTIFAFVLLPLPCFFRFSFRLLCRATHALLVPVLFFSRCCLF